VTAALPCTIYTRKSSEQKIEVAVSGNPLAGKQAAAPDFRLYPAAGHQGAMRKPVHVITETSGVISLAAVLITAPGDRDQG